MSKKIIFVFAGTGDNAKLIHEVYEGTSGSPETFKEDVIRVYFNGCQDKRIGGHTYVKGLIAPDLDVIANQIDNAFVHRNNRVELDLAALKQTLGDAIIIEPPSAAQSIEPIDEITLTGFSRGAVTTFATAKALDHLNIPLSILASDPVPGNSRAHTYDEMSLYAKNANLSNCNNIVRADILLGTYSKHNAGWENKWFRQMAPVFNENTKNHIFLVPKKQHLKFNEMAATYKSRFLYQQGLTQTDLFWKENQLSAQVIPKIEQQKFHFGVMGRAEYLPTYKDFILRSLQNNYTADNPCPIHHNSPFKWGQALFALYQAHMDSETFQVLSKTILNISDKAKGLREFLVELNSIIQYCKDLHKSDTEPWIALENALYPLIAEFQKLESPSLKECDAFEQNMLATIEQSRATFGNTFHKLSTLITLFLKENTLTHPHFTTFIDENETFAVNALKAKQPAIDALVKDAKTLATKLFYSSVRQRSVIFEQVKDALPHFIKTASDLASIVPFLTSSELKSLFARTHVAANQVVDVDAIREETLEHTIKNVDDVLLILQVLPTDEHKHVFYQIIQHHLLDMNLSLPDLIHMMAFLPQKDCKLLCNLLPTASLLTTASPTTDTLITTTLYDDKRTLLESFAHKSIHIHRNETFVHPSSLKEPEHEITKPVYPVVKINRVVPSDDASFKTRLQDLKASPSVDESTLSPSTKP